MQNQKSKHAVTLFSLVSLGKGRLCTLTISRGGGVTDQQLCIEIGLVLKADECLQCNWSFVLEVCVRQGRELGEGRRTAVKRCGWIC